MDSIDDPREGCGLREEKGSMEEKHGSKVR